MIHDIPKWWDFLTYDGLKSDVNVATFAEERIRVKKQEAGKRAFNEAYYKFQANQYKA